MLPNAVPVNGSSIVFYVILNHDFCELLDMHLMNLTAWKIPISSPQQASVMILLSATSPYLMGEKTYGSKDQGIDH